MECPVTLVIGSYKLQMWKVTPLNKNCCLFSKKNNVLIKKILNGVLSVSISLSFKETCEYRKKKNCSIPGLKV